MIFPNLISDLIKHLIPYSTPASVIISSLGQTNVKGNVYIVQSFELKIPHYKAGCIMCHHKYRIRFYLDLINVSKKKNTQFKTTVHKPIPYFRPKRSKLIPCFRPKWLKHHSLCCCTYQYSLYKGVNPPTPPPSRTTGACTVERISCYFTMPW